MLQFILEADGRILLFIQEHLRFEWLDPVVVFLTKLANAGTIWIILAAVLLCFKRYRKTGCAMAVALLIGYVATNLLLKNLVMRPRPFDAIPALHALVAEGGWSFPSGHTTSSMAAGYVMYKRMPRYIGIPALALAIIISLSRLYVGVHYPTDVLCGMLIGLTAGMCALRVIGNGRNG